MKTLLRKLKSFSPSKRLHRFYEPIIISFLGALLFVSPIIFGPSGSQVNWQHVFNVWLMLIPYVALYLINRFILLPYLLLKNKQIAFLLCAAILIIAMAFTVNPYFDHRYNPDSTLQEPTRSMSRPPELPPNYRQGFDRPPEMLHDGTAMEPGPGPKGDPKNGQPMRPPKNLPPYLSFIIVGVLIVGFDTGLRLWVKWIESEQQIVKAEKENIQSQLALLRTQVSPHFFMNTLNNIHALIAYDTEGAQDSIIHLSKLMRHLLYESERSQIELHREMDFVNNYIDLMKIRFSDSVEINLDLPDNIPQKKIPPLLFTSFIENAFKHGISYREKSFINVTFHIANNQLEMQIENSNHSEKQSDHQHGLGVNNSRKRLDILYGDKYSLLIEDSPKTHHVKLNIPI